MTTILTINAGSSSLRLDAFALDEGGRRLAARHDHEVPADPSEHLATFVGEHALAEPRAIVHRVVHGGPHLTEPALIDATVEREIDRLARLAPLHNPRALAWISAARRCFGGKPMQLAVFDTALFATLPAVASSYALPLDLQRRHGIRRFGFHGLAHGALWRRWSALAPDLEGGGRCISLQLGSGCSAAALAHGRPVDTSMGFSPLEGLVMATRSGDLDPGLLAFLCRHERLDPEALDRLLNESAGLLGLSALSGDMRVLLEADSPEARLAIDVYCYRARKYIGAYAAALGGLDAVLFGGGVGENAPSVRSRIVSGLEWFGIEIDQAVNDASVGVERRISSAGSRVQLWTLPVDESEAMAAAARDRLAADG